MHKSALLLVNQKARKGRSDLGQTVSRLRRGGIELIDEAVDGPQWLAKAIKFHHGKIDVVIIGGGDGTLNAAAEALVKAQLPTWNSSTGNGK